MAPLSWAIPRAGGRPSVRPSRWPDPNHPSSYAFTQRTDCGTASGTPSVQNATRARGWRRVPVPFVGEFKHQMPGPGFCHTAFRLDRLVLESQVASWLFRPFSLTPGFLYQTRSTQGSDVPRQEGLVTKDEGIEGEAVLPTCLASTKKCSTALQPADHQQARETFRKMSRFGRTSQIKRTFPPTSVR
ncbi:hypothetical protein LY78DRAFT_187746 [Colletotrichum sublineola]|nr:hypothetical protein LY78DRAFT_187746 [Colletotrichum sublineola]